MSNYDDLLKRLDANAERWPSVAVGFEAEAAAAIRELQEELEKTEAHRNVLRERRDAVLDELIEARAVIAKVREWADGEPYEVSDKRAGYIALGPNDNEVDELAWVRGYQDAVRHVEAILNATPESHAPMPDPVTEWGVQPGLYAQDDVHRAVSKASAERVLDTFREIPRTLVHRKVWYGEWEQVE